MSKEEKKKHTRMNPPKVTFPSSSTSIDMLTGLVKSGSMISVNLLGVVSTILVKRDTQVEMNVSGEADRLSSSVDKRMNLQLKGVKIAHHCIVALLSEVNSLRSDWTVTFAVVTSGPGHQADAVSPTIR